MLLPIEKIKIGQKWFSAGNPEFSVTITDIKLWDTNNKEHLASYDIYYKYDDGKINDKDAFNFQVRYFLPDETNS